MVEGSVVESVYTPTTVVADKKAIAGAATPKSKVGLVKKTRWIEG